MPLEFEKWSRKRKINHGRDWPPLSTPPPPLTKQAAAAVLVSKGETAETFDNALRVKGNTENKDGACALLLVDKGAHHHHHHTDTSDDQGCEIGASIGIKVNEGEEANMNTREEPSTSLCPPNPAVLSHYKLVKLFKSFRLQRPQHDHKPLKIVRASNQYMYDNNNSEYIDCVNFVSHVGHSHPSVARAAYLTNNLNAVTPGWDIDWGKPSYPQQLHCTLPQHLDTFLFCNSGSEAVDLSMQLSQLYTCGSEVIVTDNAFHGSIDSVHMLSPKVFKATNTSNAVKADWVHVIPMPDLYRGEHRREDPMAIHKYLAETREVVERATQGGKKIACFICEPMLIVAGCIMPPSIWLQEVYKMVRECGGLCIADEVQTGLGRLGSHFWSFLTQEVTPDIVIIGKTIGNGYPMAAAVTSKEIAAVLGDRIKEYRCSQVIDAVGGVVLDQLRQDHLTEGAATVGTYLSQELLRLQDKHDYIGDVRGQGLMFGIDVVWSRESRKPAQEIAEQIVNKMREEYVILANEGNERNVLMVMPPMCFSQENAATLIQRFDKVLSELPKQRVSKEMESGLLSYRILPGVCEGRLGIIQPQEDEDEESDESLSTRSTSDRHQSQHNYEDLD